MADSKKFFTKFFIFAFIIFLLILTGPFYIVNEGEQVVITRIGKIVNSHTEAGLYVKVPFIDKVTTYTKLVLSLDGDPQKITTKEQQFLIVDTTARWRITNPEKFYQNFQTMNNAYNTLSDIFDASTRTIITQNRLSEIVRSSNIINETQISAKEDENAKELLGIVNENTENETVTKGRRELSNQMRNDAAKLVAGYGIELIDIVPRQIKYADENTESVYSRMIKDRNQVAQAYRSNGEGKKAEWLGKLENEKAKITSEAYRKSEEIKGAADAEAARIYADAYNKDPEFYTFWKSMESYKKTLKDYDATYSTNMNYFDYLYSPDGKR